jgi:predicted Zn-ribbon and HTH transcriptional regulator
MEEKIKLIKLTCQRCGWEWYPRVAAVKQCPGCRSLRFRTPRSSSNREETSTHENAQPKT